MRWATLPAKSHTSTHRQHRAGGHGTACLSATRWHRPTPGDPLASPSMRILVRSSRIQS